MTGAEQTEVYIPELKGKKVAIVLNQTSIIHNTFLLDSLLHRNVEVTLIYSPEHGFRGVNDAGEIVEDTQDPVTKIPVVSLYGKSKKDRKPSVEDMAKADVVLFDIQDVGARFYTYLTSLHYVMEACAEQNKPLILLDRPNPNAYYVDGPILDTATSRSFVGMHPVPIVYGMTIGEYAKMLNEEGWLANKVKCNLTVVPLKNYTHRSSYKLPVKPSPNLNTSESIYLYPSLCLFEGTTISMARGTLFPFQAIGHPSLKGKYTYYFTPKSIEGMSKEPPYRGQRCYGLDLSSVDTSVMRSSKQLNFAWLLEMYKVYPQKEKFFNNFFDLLAGTKTLKEQIKAGKTEAEIRKSWQPGLEQFKGIRSKYLLYRD